MSSKLATTNLVKIKLFRNKGHDVIIIDYNVNNKILSRDLTYILVWLYDQSLVTLVSL